MGKFVGESEGLAVGVLVGSNVGSLVGESEGLEVGVLVGANVGEFVGEKVRRAVVGMFVGTIVGAFD